MLDIVSASEPRRRIQIMASTTQEVQDEILKAVR